MTRGQVIDKRFYPPGFPMGDPRQLKSAQAFQLAQHILDIGELEFHHWQSKNGEPQPPVPFVERFWAASRDDEEALVQQARKEAALNAYPTHFADSWGVGEGQDDGGDYPAALPARPAPAVMSRNPAPGGVTSRTLSQSSSAAHSLTPGRGVAPGASAITPGLVMQCSPYGSAMAQNIHGDMTDGVPFVDPAFLVKDDDPDDLFPSTALVGHVHAPCSVPQNAEARAQWSYAILAWPSWSDHVPVSALKTCITRLAELPVCWIIFE